MTTSGRTRWTHLVMLGGCRLGCSRQWLGREPSTRGAAVPAGQPAVMQACMAITPTVTLPYHSSGYQAERLHPAWPALATVCQERECFCCAMCAVVPPIWQSILTSDDNPLTRALSAALPAVPAWPCRTPLSSGSQSSHCSSIGLSTC
jgi:hypothetical protein